MAGIAGLKKVIIRRSLAGAAPVIRYTQDTTAPIFFRYTPLEIGRKYTYEIVHNECWYDLSGYHCGD